MLGKVYALPLWDTSYWQGVGGGGGGEWTGEGRERERVTTVVDSFELGGHQSA